MTTQSVSGAAPAKSPQAKAAATSKGKPKSPPAPSRSLREAFADVQKLYGTYGRSEISRAELASTLEISATAGSTVRRIFTFKEFGLVVQTGENFKVAEDFIQWKATTTGSPEFKRAAYKAVVRCGLFKELITSFNSKLPPQAAIATRLETQKKFNADRAQEIAGVLEDSLKFAGVLDASNNILPPRDSEAGADDTAQQGSEAETAELRPPAAPPKKATIPGALTMEIPLRDGRRVVVSYPPDLASDEAGKVAKVLNAVVVAQATA